MQADECASGHMRRILRAQVGATSEKVLKVAVQSRALLSMNVRAKLSGGPRTHLSSVGYDRRI